MLIDVHAHLGRLHRDRRQFLDVTDLILKMDAWGIERACVLCLSEHPEGHYLQCSTEDIIAECSRHPDRLVPFCLIDPRFGYSKPDMDFGYLLEEYTARGCKGMGEMLPKLDFDDPRCLNLFRQVGQFGLPIIFDMNDTPSSYGLRDDPGLPRLEHTLQACPDTLFVGHGPTFWAEVSADVAEDQRTSYPPPDAPIVPGGAVPRLMAKYPNLWADLSAGSGYHAISRDLSFTLEFFDQFQDKLLFGTDSCQRMNDTPTCPNVDFMNKLRNEKLIAEAAWAKIASGNAIRLLGL
jgi:uncharacterized protein